MSIFYKITAPNGKISHLFGTIHLNDTAIVTLPLEVKEALERATYCVFEVDGNSFIENPVGAIILDLNWQDAQAQHRSRVPGDYISIVKANPGMNFINRENIQQVSPLHLAQNKIAASAQPLNCARWVNALDLQLMRFTKLKNKKIKYLESIDEQLAALKGYNLNILEQIEFYRFIEAELAKGRKFPHTEDLIHEYQHQQDIQKMQDMLRVFPAKTNIPEPVRRYYDGISVDRDLTMAMGMEPYLGNGNAFVAVGVCHLKGITDKLQADGYKIDAVALGERHYSIEGTIEDGKKVAAFRKIYTALYMAQTSFFKKRGLVPTDNQVVSLKEIQDYISTNKNTRSFKAWELAQKHYKNISSDNTELLKSVCHEGYAKSSSFFGLFRHTKTNLDDAQSVANASPETRTGIVRDILNGAPCR